MKSRDLFKLGSFHVFHPLILRSAFLGILVAALCPGCATQNEAGVVRSAVGNPKGIVALEAGSVGVAIPDTDGKFSFVRAHGRINSVGEGAGSAARNVLLTPNLGDPLVEGPAGLIEFVAAPFAAGYGAIRASQQKLSPTQLNGAEADLTRAFESAVRQDRLRQWFLKIVAEKSRARVIPLDLKLNSPDQLDGMGTIVETRIEELNLEPVKGDYYVLKIKARARVLRVSDRTLVLERPFEYQSGKALFIDWTRKGGLESVAETGYRVLAMQMARDTLEPLMQEPMLLGEGHKALRTPALKSAGISVAASRGAVKSPVRFLNCELQTGSQIEIYSTGSATSFLFNPPMTKKEAVSEAVTDTEWALDGLQNCRNSVVQIGSCLTAIPIGLWKQSYASIQGLTRSKLEFAQTALRTATMQSRPGEAIAGEVARSFSTQGSLNVVLVSAPASGKDREQTLCDRDGVRATFVSLKPNAGGVSLGVPETGDTALEITVSYAGFTATDGINPRIPLTVDAQVTLFRKSDGQQLYSCPIHYRSVARTFSAWAADDARLFRQEAGRCYSQIGDSVVKELIGRGVVAPVQISAPLLVTK